MVTFNLVKQNVVNVGKPRKTLVLGKFLSVKGGGWVPPQSFGKNALNKFLG